MAPSFAAGAVLLLTSLTTAASELHPLSDEFISLINSQQNSWKAGRNFPKDTPMAYIKRLTGVIKDESMPALPVKVHDADVIASLPKNFDPREKWPNCPSLNEINDQENCGSCWAFGSVEVMTDRMCINSNAKKHFYYSAEDLISCFGKDGCRGGSHVWAFKKWVEVGIVSGGSYNSSEGCMPYSIEPCDHRPSGEINRCKEYADETPDCKRKCRAGYDVEYEKDKHHGDFIYSVEGEHDIKAELYTHGPLSASFEVHFDFFHYKSGVYTQSNNSIAGYHAVKMLGWGEEGGKKYWLMANSWNSDWGDKGFFKILRGEDECGIEATLVAGMPVLD